MPLITAAYLSYTGGLLAGFSGFGWIAVVAAAIAFAAALFRGRADRSALALVFAAAVIIAAATPPPERPTAHQKNRQPPTDVLSRVRARAARSITARLARTLLWRARSL